jgi:tRNA wybutosine-synthesizing protein 1
LGRVSLVEMKGVTYCGKSDASNLNMSNTPFHHEVVALARDLKVELDKLREEQERMAREHLRVGSKAEQREMMPIPRYDLACEHQHSCSVLLARVDQFAVDDPASGKRKWRTWIDYEKFYELAVKNAADPSFSFDVQDYTADTPDWALFGANEAGFDPTEIRHRKESKQPKYTRFDNRGVPTHDHNDDELIAVERNRLNRLMDERLLRLGGSGASVITQSRDGGKEIADASLMFRGLVVSKG